MKKCNTLQLKMKTKLNRKVNEMVCKINYAKASYLFHWLRSVHKFLGKVIICLRFSGLLSVLKDNLH